MSANNLTKSVLAAFAAAACACVMASVGAAELNDQASASNAYANPFSLPCHPSTDRGACLKHADSAASRVTTIARLDNVPIGGDPVSAPCHPSNDRGACLKHAQ